jgi:hypothetical protein
MCQAYLQMRVQPSTHKWVCILNLADAMRLEAQQHGFAVRKRPLRDLLTQAAAQLGYLVESVYIRNCECLP